MKHAGRPRRGATRPGREKRRRRNEASVEARDEEPGPIGTCTPTILSGGAPGAVFRPPPSIMASFGSPRSARESAVVRWMKPTVRSGPGLEAAPARTPPSGSGHGGTTEGPELDRARWDAAGPLGASCGSPSSDGRTHGTPGVPAALRQSGLVRWPSVVPPHAGRSRVDRPSRLADPSSTATDSSVVGQGWGCGPRRRLDTEESPSGGRSEHGSASAAWTDSGSGSGK